MFLVKRYKQLLQHNIYKFLLMWLFLAFAPLVISFGLEVFFPDRIKVSYGNVLQLRGMVVMLILFFSIFLAIYSAFNKKISHNERFLIIMGGFLIMWLAFANFYYLCGELHEILLMNDSTSNTIVLQGMPTYWQTTTVDGVTEYDPINRMDNYISCLYFSAMTITTVGYGDLTPGNSLTKVFVIIETFLGQFIMVVAVGLWFADMEDKD